MYLESAKMAAKAKDKDDKWLITLQFPSYFPFMKFSNKRVGDIAEITACNLLLNEGYEVFRNLCCNEIVFWK